MRKSKFNDSQMMDAVKRVEAGFAVPDICRELGISTATFYKWRAQYGGMDVSMMARMKELEDENRHLKKMYHEEKLKDEIVAEALEKNGDAVSQTGEGPKSMTDRGVCIRVTCQAFGICESCYRYERKLDVENAEVATWLMRLTHNHRSWGFGLCYLCLRNVKGFKWNYKRVYRIYKELELNLRIKPRKRLVREKPEALTVPQGINQVWSMDFMHDQLEGGRTFRLLNVIDDLAREAIGLEVDFSLPSERVIRELKQIIAWRGRPQVIRCDNARSTSVRRSRTGHLSGVSGWNTSSGATQSKMLMSSGSTGRCDTSGCDSNVGMTWQRSKTLQRSGCGLTTMTDPIGPGRIYTKVASSYGCITLLLLRPLKKGRITS